MLPKAARSSRVLLGCSGVGNRRDGRSLQVSFSDTLSVEIPVFAAPQDAQGRLFPASSAEDRARANLLKLVANHRRSARTWSFAQEFRSLFESAWTRHVALLADMLLIGPEPSHVHKALRLAGSQVALCGRTIVISPKLKDSGCMTLQLDTTAEAEKWASKLHAAAAIWESTQSTAESALLFHGECRRSVLPPRHVPPGHAAPPKAQHDSLSSHFKTESSSSDLTWTKLVAWEEGDLFGQLILEPLQSRFGCLAAPSLLQGLRR